MAAGSPTTHTAAALAPEAVRVARGFDRRAASYRQHAFVEPLLRERLLERLELIRIEPQRILDLGSAAGESSFALARRYRRATVIAADRSAGMLRGLLEQRGWRLRRRVRPLLCDAAAVPVADGSIDLVFSSLLLHWHADPAAVFAECRRVLRPGGLLLFNTFGPDTLRELRGAWRAVDEAAHVNLFLDMHDLGDALQRAGLAAPVMDTETLTISHETPAALFRDLRATTPGNVLAGRPRGLLGRERHTRLLAALERTRRDGRLPTTLEVVYGHAWGHTPTPRETGPQEVRVPISSLRRRPSGR
ncbi:MAG: methyltransferase domain-containing protein [Gammaproteobacteria bacterium]|nr:methyltransferase domain-containing protein [Gammaproteobacteria bacterium]TVQ45939.1 MAG: methyltransferase domain-containing protein [Gammaproteobacteria bacterium]